jgi:hypothetical protein
LAVPVVSVLIFHGVIFVFSVFHGILKDQQQLKRMQSWGLRARTGINGEFRRSPATDGPGPGYASWSIVVIPPSWLLYCTRSPTLPAVNDGRLLYSAHSVLQRMDHFTPPHTLLLNII